MSSLTSRFPTVFAIAGLAVALLAGCGDEDAQTLAFTLSGDGKASKFSGPTSAEPGLAEITLRNDGGQEGDLQLIRIEGDRSAQEIANALGDAVQGKPLPDWFFAAGGTGLTAPGESQTVKQVLMPGTYYAFNTESNGPPDPKSALVLDVEGEASDDQVEADATISAFEYGFEGEGLTSGSTEIAFENSGTQPHHIVYAPLSGDATAADVNRFLKTEKGKPPFEDKDVHSTAAVEGGESQLVTLDLKPGRYVLLCFISDRQGGPPHAFKGMVEEVEVEG